MLSNKKRKIYVASTKELKSPSYYKRLWLATRNMPIARRNWLDEIADALRDFDGLIIDPSGECYLIPDIDDTFGNDADMRWIGYYLKEGRYGYPSTTSKKYDRLKMLDLYFKIRHPDIARHFGR